MEFDQKSGKALLSGNVHVTNGEMEVWADRMDVRMDAQDDLETLLAVGNVVIKKGDDVAICGRAEYDAAKTKLILTDTPVVRRGKNMRLTAPIFTYDQDKEKFVADGNGGRAKLTFVPEGGKDTVLDKYRKKKGGTGTP
jgi:lipopolysaccharide transport protein LptA